MYKDKDKRRDKERDRQRRYGESHPITGKRRDKEGVTEPKGVTESEAAHRRLQGINYAQPAPPPTTPYPNRGQANIPADKREQVAKRGKDIKTFADLPPDVQATINRLSQSNEEKQKRTKAAIKYQHLFPDRFHSTGIVQTAEIGELR